MLPRQYAIAILTELERLSFQRFPSHRTSYGITGDIQPLSVLTTTRMYRRVEAVSDHAKKWGNCPTSNAPSLLRLQPLDRVIYGCLGVVFIDNGHDELS